MPAGAAAPSPAYCARLCPANPGRQAEQRQGRRGRRRRGRRGRRRAAHLPRSGASGADQVGAAEKRLRLLNLLYFLVPILAVTNGYRGEGMGNLPRQPLQLPLLPFLDSGAQQVLGC